ncbi:MAG: MFS transporter [Sphingomonadales bacterium]
MNGTDDLPEGGEFRLGWKVLLAATLGVSMATTAIPFYAMGVFVTPLEQARGWSRSDISMAATVFSFSLPLAILMLGPVIDRFGVRRVATFGHVMLGLAYLALSATGGDVRIFWVIYAVAAVAAVGASPITYARAVIQYFTRFRGLAIGICMSGTGIGAALAPPVLEWVIRTRGIEAGYQMLALALFGLAAIVYLLLPVERKSTSEDAARGAVAGSAQDDKPKAVPSLAANRPGLMISLICLGIFMVALSVNGYIIHMVPLLEGRGLTSGQAAGTAAYLGLAVIFGRLFTGFLLDRFPTGLIGSVVFSAAACGILLLHAADPIVAPISVILIGFTVGAEVDLVAYLVSTLFRKADFSRYFSRVYAAFMLGAGVSPLIAGRIFDRDGDYAFFFNVSGGVLMTISLAFLLLHVLQRRSVMASA